MSRTKTNGEPAPQVELSLGLDSLKVQIVEQRLSAPFGKKVEGEEDDYLQVISPLLLDETDGQDTPLCEATRRSKADVTGFIPGNVKSESWHIANIMKLGEAFSLAGMALAKAVWDALDDGIEGRLIVIAWEDKGYPVSTIRNLITDWKHENGVKVQSNRGRKVENLDEVGNVLAFFQEEMQKEVNFGLAISDVRTKYKSIARAVANKLAKVTLEPKAE
jgi:hypothetical protein